MTSVALLVLALAMPQDSVNRLTVPELVHQRERTDQRGDNAIVQALEHRLKCTCGCGLDVFVCRTTDFSCATSPAMHRVVLARLDSGMTADQVVAAFERQYGTSILMQPPKRGFNWAAYIVPFVALGVGIVILAAVMRRWMTGRREPRGESGAEANGGSPPAQSGDMERLQRELETYEA